uniref:Major facilitator superfamily (MFS) profile domain-containing protein n=1 Tax=Timema poppense TaxID=170557 RepID=A0A7R9H2T1_TIMPO|nr:unnamed protein product [Timema poppensis]
MERREDRGGGTKEYNEAWNVLRASRRQTWAQVKCFFFLIEDLWVGETVAGRRNRRGPQYTGISRLVRINQLDFQEGEFEWNDVTQGQILASYYYGYIMTQILGGYLAGRFGGKYVLGGGIFASGIVTLLFPILSRLHVYALITARIMQGAFQGVMLPAMHSMFSQWFPPNEQTSFSGIIFSAMHLGTVTAMGLSGYLVSWGGWELIFYVFGGSAIVFFFPWLYLVYNSPQVHPRISLQEKTYILSGLRKDLEKQKSKVLVPWCRMLTSVPLWAGIYMNFGLTWVLYTLLAQLPTYTKNILHFDIKQSGALSAIPYLFAWTGSLFWSYISQLLRKKNIMSQITTYKLFNGIGSALSLYLVTVFGCNTTAIMILFVLTMTSSGAFLGGSAINHIDLASNFAGTLSGITFTITNFAGFFSPLVTSAIVSERTATRLLPLVLFHHPLYSHQAPGNDPSSGGTRIDTRLLNPVNYHPVLYNRTCSTQGATSCTTGHAALRGLLRSNIKQPLNSS